MTSDAFYSYMSDVFFPWIKEKHVPQPVAVFLDGYVSHLSLPVCEFCNKNGIILITLPRNATHILQPMDVGIFGPLKKLWKDQRALWERNNSNINFHILQMY